MQLSLGLACGYSRIDLDKPIFAHYVGTMGAHGHNVYNDARIPKDLDALAEVV
jgi:hypothetical protein